MDCTDVGLVLFGAPGSHGCVRMGNADVVALYDRVPVGTPVFLEE